MLVANGGAASRNDRSGHSGTDTRPTGIAEHCRLRAGERTFGFRPEAADHAPGEPDVQSAHGGYPTEAPRRGRWVSRSDPGASRLLAPASTNATRGLFEHRKSENDSRAAISERSGGAALRVALSQSAVSHSLPAFEERLDAGAANFKPVSRRTALTGSCSARIFLGESPT